MNPDHPGGHPLFELPPQPRRRTSEVVLELADRAGAGPLSLRTLTEGLGDRGFGMLLIVLAAFNVIPFVSLFSGLLVSLLGLQMALGSRQPRLPAAVLDRRLPPDATRRALRELAPRIARIETVVRPRWHFTEAAIVDRVNGLLLAVLGVIIALPIPFTNIAPAVIVVVMGLGLLERDGLVQCLALTLGVVTVAVIHALVLLAT